jgi:hypothetical protein
VADEREQPRRVRSRPRSDRAGGRWPKRRSEGAPTAGRSEEAAAADTTGIKTRHGLRRSFVKAFNALQRYDPPDDADWRRPPG